MRAREGRADGEVGDRGGGLLPKARSSGEPWGYSGSKKRWSLVGRYSCRQFANNQAIALNLGTLSRAAA